MAQTSFEIDEKTAATSNESKEAMEDRDLYIEGYFTQRVRAGERPKYGYPTNHLPETTIARMQIHTSFMASRKPK
jgi:hypothetical protein